MPCLTALLTVGDQLDLYEKDMYGRTPQDILKDILGRRRGAASNSSKAIRKDRRTPWKERVLRRPHCLGPPRALLAKKAISTAFESVRPGDHIGALRLA